MRAALLAIALALALAVPVAAQAPQVTPASRTTVYLYGEDDLALLRQNNPGHYARAQRIFAAANHLCRPGAAHTEHTAAAAHDVSCAAMLLRTSNPPKYSISFTLDETRYIALMTITDDPPRAVPAQ